MSSASNDAVSPRHRQAGYTHTGHQPNPGRVAMDPTIANPEAAIPRAKRANGGQSMPGLSSTGWIVALCVPIHARRAPSRQASTASAHAPLSRPTHVCPQAPP